ncbi:hypothetical protein CCAX7_009650 [Capsulimonas corticalis]|uniref:Protein OrfX2/OrfX3/P47 domain-containing protein n=1 Tax=Capsulimonas corticalis TaxID=2219043 RepID=A0A402CUC2_9BACT|nr:TULIP family P47-like protein [Capsulimonas corticalis]BDI28914.1 hypothetical protein CCAX7_009650 [Capsulimonas corticalis]
MSTETLIKPTEEMLTQASTFHTFPLPHQSSFAPEVFIHRSEIPSYVLAAEANTYGWDTVNCIRLPIVNEVLKKSQQFPAHLEMTIDESTGWSIAADFDAWQVAQGGSGAILMMKLPLKSAAMNYSAGENNQKTLNITNGYALISIKLRYLPQASPARAAGDNPLEIEQLLSDPFPRSSDDPAVVVQKIDYGSATPDEVAKSLFVAAFSLLMTDNLDKFTHIFAVVNLNAKAAHEEYLWLKPTYTSYAYFQGLDEKSSYFAVLNQTEGRSTDGLTNQAPGSAIPADCDAAILISLPLFLQKVMLPGMTRAFTQAPADAFIVKNLGQVIENTQRVKMNSVKVAGSNYTPYLDELVLQVVGDELQMQTRVSINISPGIDAYVNATYYNAIGLVQKPDLTYTLDFEQSRDPIIESYYKVAPGVIITQIIVGMIGTIIGAVVYEVLKEGVMRVIIVALITIVSGVAAATPTIIAEAVKEGLTSVLPGIGPLVNDATDPVQWPSSSGFSIKTAELNGSFQMGGTLLK